MNYVNEWKNNERYIVANTGRIVVAVLDFARGKLYGKGGRDRFSGMESTTQPILYTLLHLLVLSKWDLISLTGCDEIEQ